jgi:hypothetical protein
MITAYIAHPISGDVEGNVKRVKAIMADIIRDEPTTFPFAPYLTALELLDDDKPDHRARGITWNMRLLNSEVVDEVRLYGDRVSEGMLEEVAVAMMSGIKVVPKSDAARGWIRSKSLAWKRLLKRDQGKRVGE